ncbi:MAG: FAD-dependent oxidoreductase [Candidatus Thorarchaeota archaeon]
MTTEREPLPKTAGKDGSKSNKALVVGGGVAGMQAALDIANQGFEVTLLEKSASIGGRMAQIDKTFPTLDCSACILTPKLSEVARHPNIDLLTYSEIKSVSGETGDFHVLVHKHARYVDEDKCSGCNECIPVCPVEVPNEFDEKLGFRKAIYKPFPQATPNVVTVDKKGEPACRATCPAGVNAQGFITLMRHGMYAEALEIVRRAIPFAGALGRVCVSYCEGECERGMLDESVSIRNLHRFLADYERMHEPAPVVAKIDKKDKVAVIGAGPAGISCAYQLARLGYPVTIFEAREEPGGMLRYAIPEYRLPRDVLAEEIQRVLDMGVKLKTKTKVKSIKSLQEKGFKAVFIATGTWKSNRLGLKGEDAEGVLHAIDFLEAASRGERMPIGNRVAVIGGGDAAIDSARVAVRLGAKDVTLIYRRSHIELPAIPSEVEDAMKEGVKFMLLTSPKELVVKDGKLRGVRCVKMRLGEPDSSGRKRPVPIPNSEFTMALDSMIIAVGQSADQEGVQTEVECSKWGNAVADPVTLATNTPGVFAGGDIVLGPSTVVKAVGHGNQAAISIDRYLRGEDIAKGRTKTRNRVQSYEVDKTGVPPDARALMSKQDVESRVRNFDEVEVGFTESIAREEAERCLGCAVCCECERCVDACQRDAIDHTMHDEIIDLHVGAIVLATGYRMFDVEEYTQFGYGKLPNVITAMEFERLINAAGPTQGHLIRLSDGRKPKSVGFIQCVGARDVQKGVPYCSRVCCMYGIKNSVMVKQHYPDADVTVYYADIRAFGKGFEEFYEDARSRFGVKFMRGRVAEVSQSKRNGTLVVRVEDTETSKLRQIEHDLIIISPGIQPPQGLDDLAVELNMDLSEEGYVDIRDTLTTPVDTPVAGVFVCGCADGPKDIPDSVSAGSAAAMRASIVLSKGGKAK